MKTLPSMRKSARIVPLALLLSGMVSSTPATLLVYEPFQYPASQNLTNGIMSLSGQSGGADAVGMVGTWTANGNGTVSGNYNPVGTNGVAVIAANSVPGPIWKGNCTSVPQKGNYAGSPAAVGFAGLNGNNPDHMWASRPLAPNIVTNFTLGATNWMCCVQVQNFTNNYNYGSMTFCLGQGVQNGASVGSGDPSGGRGQAVYGGPAIGIGTAFPSGAVPKYLIAGAWDTMASDGMTYVEQNYLSSTGILVVTPLKFPPVWICIAKIVWGDVSNPTTVTFAAFPDGTALSEATFDQFTSTNLQQVTTYVDPTTFTNISLGGARWECDELRIGTTFNDIIGLVAATYGNYWAPGASGGGTGTWAAGSKVWATVPNVQGANAQSPTDTLIFSGASGTVTVNGTATVNAGLQFGVTGYNLVAGSSSPQILLAGANAAANTINVNSGVSATNSVPLAGANGFSKTGLGSLTLGPGNTFTGNTVLGAGTLQITDATSLSGGNVDFQGGTLQYPPGSGSTSLDVSGKISTVNSGQTAIIDTQSNRVTFASGIGGAGSLTKLGNGSLTLAGANTYLGPTTVSAGTLNLSSASGVIAALNVPAGGTVNLGAGAVVGTLNIAGGTLNLTGAGAQVGTLFVSSGTCTNPSNYALIVTNTANLQGVAFTLSGAGSFTLNGSDLLNPTSANQRIVTGNGGTLSFVAQGLDAAIGSSAPGNPAVAATTTFLGSGGWVMTNAAVGQNNDTYGTDNHAFHYIIVPTGDFDINCQITGTSPAGGVAGLVARDHLTARSGNYIGVWSSLNNNVYYGFSTNSRVVAMAGMNPGFNPAYLELTRTGNLITTYCSADGTNYTQVNQVDYTGFPWGATTYLGLDLTGNSSYAAAGSFTNVNFMGTAGSADLSTTEFALNNGAKLDLGPVMYVSHITTNGVALTQGCWAGSGLTGANHVDPTIFTSTGPGIAVIPSAVPLTVVAPDIYITTTDPYNWVQVNYSPVSVVGGTPPYTATNYVPTDGTYFPVGTTWVTCSVTDSSCPFGHTAYRSFRVTVGPPAPVMNPAADSNTGFSLSGGMPTFTFSSVIGFNYRVVFTTNVTDQLSTWLPLVTALTDANGWLYATGTYTTISDSSASGPMRFYRVQVTTP